jgi:hypothetical protein
MVEITDIDPWTGKPFKNAIDQPTGQEHPPGTAGVNALWTGGTEPYRANGVELGPYQFDPAYWQQRQQMSAGFRSGLKEMPGVLDPLTQLTTGYPYFLPYDNKTNSQNMYQLPAGTDKWPTGSSGSDSLGLLAGLTPEQKSQLLLLLQNTLTGGTGGTGGIGTGGIGGAGTGGMFDPIITDSGQGRPLPRPVPGTTGTPGVHEPGGWQWDGRLWNWVSQPSVTGGSGSPTG